MTASYDPSPPQKTGGRLRRLSAGVLDPKSWPPGDGPIPIWMSLAGLGGGVGFAVAAASGGPDALETIAFLAGAAALGGLGLYGVAERLVFAGGPRRFDWAAAFAALHEAAPEPTALIDADGRVLALNRAARAAAPGPASDVESLMAEAAFDGLTPPRAQIFSLLAGAVGRGPRTTRLAPPTGDLAPVEVAVWPLGEGRLAWRWTRRDLAPSPNAAAASLTESELLWCRVRRDGALGASSPAFDRAFSGLAPADRALARLFPEVAAEHAAAPDAPRAFLGTPARRPSGRAAVANLLLIPFASGEALCLLTPLESPPRARRAAAARAGALERLPAARLFRDAPIGMATLSLDGRILELNAVADRMLSADARPAADRVEDPLGAPLLDWIRPEDREEVSARLTIARRSGAGLGPAVEARIGRGGRSGRIAQLSFSRAADAPDLLILHLIDASEQRGLEERFIQAQKLQAVGQLAGGVAHDFNNLLTIILGASESMLAGATVDDPNYGDLSAIEQSARRAASLVRQLLAFSRKQTLTPEIVSMPELLGELTFMLDRLLGERVRLDQNLAEDAWPTRVDVNQFEQVVTNLVVNARQALPPNGGRIRLSCRNVAMEQPKSGPNFAMPPGEYVCVAVGDTGCGIPADTLEKIFEPFYTTKEVGEGTGLGLSTVYGIVKQSGGFIFVESEVGVGTTFEVYLPRASESAAAATPPVEHPRPITPSRPAAQQPAPPRPPSGASAQATPAPAPRPANAGAQAIAEAKAALAARAAPRPAAEAPSRRPSKTIARRRAEGATILLVDDEDSLRVMAARKLREWGYVVIEAEDAEAALEVLLEEETPIDLLLSDVVMPNMDGPSLLRALGERRPELKTVFMSGYTRDAFSETLDSALADARSYGFLQKPFSLEGLGTAVRGALAEPGR